MTCKCRNCSVDLEFDADSIGKEVDCPKCGMTTVLFSANAQHEPPAIRARKLPEYYTPSSCEESLDLGANIEFVAGSICFVLVAVVAGLARSWWLALTLAPIALGTMSIVLVLRFCAEAVRLLKKLAGVPYSGQITRPSSAGTALSCSACRQRVERQDSACPHCSAKFE